MKLTKRERWLISRLEELSRSTVDEIQRISDNEFDLSCRGESNRHGLPSSFSAHLLRWAIREMTY